MFIENTLMYTSLYLIETLNSISDFFIFIYGLVVCAVYFTSYLAGMPVYYHTSSINNVGFLKIILEQRVHNHPVLIFCFEYISR